MLYPNANRLIPAQVKQFYREQIKPRLPRAKAMPNDGKDTLLRRAFAEETLDLADTNIQRTILLSF